MSNSIYDEVLKSKLKHLQSHPCYLPHIGLKYEVSPTKILIIAESHYLHEKFNDKFSAEEWYDNPEYIYSLINNHKSGITTRAVINDYQTAPKLIKPYTIFNNLETAYKNLFKDSKLFEECIYINYFQRPSQKNGDSIVVSKNDNVVALENLMVLNETLKPNKIIFVSSMAYNNFNSQISIDQKKMFPYIGVVPHPSSPWWNKTSVKYGVNKEGKTATGREKFLRIIRPKLENVNLIK